MTTETDALVRRLVGGDPAAEVEVRAAAATATDVPLLVACAVLTDDHGPLDRARPLATGTRDRQLVALADALLAGRTDLLDALVRDHLADHPDHLLASWIAGRNA